ncbi:rcc01693 family protein [Qingshengfaniella alkalisoli]|uniref:Phage tail assembly chaperone n=1 Tax=Qingshengfaniella alkalisoli TaxID=2599296 RepID=A0A5B8I677_9RHOB|nr:rcc01693 family protein [Qingshengfaniella alkalisoli]QDY68925.1 phage tail assembly chaperone [Qingshengfaniella alkalisoli]
MADERLDWAALRRAGLHQLRLAPDQFWSLTPLELRTMLGAELDRAGISRTGLDALMTRFPDLQKEAANDRH